MEIRILKPRGRAQSTQVDQVTPSRVSEKLGWEPSFSDNLERSRLSETSHFDARQGVSATWPTAKLHGHPGEHLNGLFRTTLSAQCCPFNLAPSQVEWTPWKGVTWSSCVLWARPPLVSKFLFPKNPTPVRFYYDFKSSYRGGGFSCSQKTLHRHEFILISNLRTGVGNSHFPENLTPVRFLFLTSNSI